MPLPSSSLPPFTEPPFIPQAIRDLPQWICWRASWDQDKGKWDKKPICVATGNGQGFTKIEMGAAYPDAVAATRRLNLAGVGFVFHAHNHIVGIDLDHCRDPKTGEIEPWAKAILDLAETYAEVSPSGTGVHLFAAGDLGGTSAIKNTPAQVEMYASGRYFTITGQHIAGTPKEVNPAPQTLEALQGRLLAFPVKPAGPTGAKTAKLAPAEGSADAFSQHAYRQTFFGKVNDLAMGALGRWVPELFPTASLEAGTGAWRVKSSDLGRGLEEDISIHPDGIVDFGVHDMGDEKKGKRSPIDLVIEWLPGDFSGEPGETSPAEAALWLCEKLGVDPRSLGFRGLGAGAFEGVDNSGDNFAGPGAEPDDDDVAKPVPVRRIKVSEILAQAGFRHAKSKTILNGIDQGEVTLVGGPSGAMKSLWVQQAAVAIIFGKAGVIAAPEIDYLGSVVFYANEDQPEQVMKRIDGIMRFHKLAWPQRLHELHLWTGKLLLRKGVGQIVVNKAEKAALKALAAEEKVGVIVVDTLAAALVSEETNLEFQMTMNLLKELAGELGVAIVVVHHFRKGQPGKNDEPTLESVRGGSTLTASARNVLFVEPPTPKEATTYGIDDEAHKYMKLNPVKQSNQERGSKQWFRREVTEIDTVDPRDGTPGEENAPVLVPFYPSGAVHQMTIVRDALAKLAAATKAGVEPRVMKRGGSRRADSVDSITGLSGQEAGRVVKELIRLGVGVLSEKTVGGNLISVLRILDEKLPENQEDDEPSI